MTPVWFDKHVIPADSKQESNPYRFISKIWEFKREVVVMRKSITVAGFTIVELIAVIAIISVLTGLLLAGVAKVRASAKIKKAKATMEQIEAALEMYSQNWGTYPNDDGSDPFTGCSRLINALESETSQAKAKGGPYVKYANELKKGPLTGPSADCSLLDPWGEPYRYHWSTNPPKVTAIGQSNSSTNITFNIWSIGPNKINDEWSPDNLAGSTHPEPSPSSLQKSYSDDIVNW